MSLLDWWNKGKENDTFFLQVSSKDKYYYEIGLKLFLNNFWHKNNLESFTKGKTKKEYIRGVVDRGKWLRKHHPIRSSPLNIIEFIIMLPKMMSSGPDAPTRIFFKKLLTQPPK